MSRRLFAFSFLFARWWINLSPRLQLLDLDAYPLAIVTGEPSPSNLTALFSKLTYPSHLTTRLPLVVPYQPRGASSEKPHAHALTR